MHHVGCRTTTALLGALLTGVVAAAPASALTTAPATSVVAPGPRAVSPAPAVAPTASPAPVVPRFHRQVTRTPLQLVNRRLAHRVPAATR